MSVIEEIEGSLSIDVASEGFDPVCANAASQRVSTQETMSLELSNGEETASSPVTTFVDREEVQLTDGRTAHIYRRLSDDIDSPYLQLIELDDGTTSYIQQTTSSSMTQTEPSDEDRTGNFKCDKPSCGKAYQSAHHLRVHKRSHTGEKPFKCEWKDCGKSFSTSYTLKSHMRVHTGEKPYDCNYPGCKKAFKTAGDLQKHTRTHTGEKPFKCPFQGCGKAFTTSNICKVHVRTHTGERPYKCPFQDCEKTFSTATNYNNHVRIHTGEKPFLCEWPGCGRRFTEYSSYYKHQVVHTDRNIFSCCHCGKHYTYSSTLLGHKKTVHNDDSCRVLNSERVRTGKRKKPLALDVPDSKFSNRISDQNDKNSTKTISTGESGVLLLPVEAMRTGDSEPSSCSGAQLATVVTATSGHQLAILSQNGSTRQLTLALTDHGSTILLPSAEQSSSDPTTKPDDQVVYIGTTTDQNSGNMMSMLEKDNSLQRMEASEGDTPATDSTPINADIWLHQPQNEDISAVIEVKEEEITSKDGDNINIHFESSQNPCEDANPSDSIAYLEIGGAKYQLKIVSADNEPVDQICLHEQSDSAETQPPSSNMDSSSVNVSENENFNVQSFLNSSEAADKKSVGSEFQNDLVQCGQDRIDPEGSQRCEPFFKKRKQ